MYNVEKWISTTIKSISSQIYTNFQAIIIDDISTDNTVKKVKKLIDNDNRFLLVENTIKKFALRNIYDGIITSKASDEDVIVILDGDDWFLNENTLGIINSYYEKDKCLITYGSHIEYPSGKRGNTYMKYPKEIIDNSAYRDYPIWLASHIRTFKYKLWKNIDTEDLLDSDGNFYEMTGDLATMFPMLEMAQERQSYISEVIHVYNRANELNDDKKDHRLQLKIDREIRSKKKYKRLEEKND